MPFSNSLILLPLLIASADVVFAVDATAITPEQATFFEQKVRPVLSQYCFECHSEKSEKLKSGLRLDSRAGLLKGGDTGPAIVPGKPADSLLIKAIQYLQEDLEMPPKKKMPNRAIEDLSRWVEQGAPWPKHDDSAPLTGGTTAEDGKKDWEQLQASHWSFRPVTRHAPPVVNDPTWAASPIDRFVLARLEAAGLRPAPPADRRVLIRRVYFDLIGLPPTPQQVDAFLRDESKDAFARVIDELLASPHYGERWARHWLDVARYSDGLGGFLDSAALPNAWRYRDWVVAAFNKDMPYDEFVRQQIAGDLMTEKAGAAAAVATGFFAVGPTYISDGGDPEATAQAKAETLADRVDTFSRAFLGLTLQCARCHDHLFDPIPQQDYYSIAGVFNNSRNHDYPVASPQEIKAYDDHQKAIKEQDQQLKKWINDTKKANGGKIPSEMEEEQKQLQARLERLKKDAPPKYAVAHTLADSGNKDMHLALRGDLRKKGELAPRRFVHIIAGADPPPFMQGSGRLELADAVVAPDNPLTARVMVNRLWQHHFGRPLVGTPDNFGKLGETPTHPLLLDWLASKFIESNWSIKEMHRTIMLSSAYQMSSDFSDSAFAKDGGNRLLWRMEPRRMEVEAWRDALLAVTGELDRTIGGEPTSNLLASHRRTIYTAISRNGDRFESDEFLRLFDFPAPRSTAATRAVSTVPQQYLFMLNSPFMLQRASALTERLTKAADNDADRIELAYQMLYSRPPTDAEKKTGLTYLRGASEGQTRWPRYAQVLLSAHEFMQIQ